MLKLHISKTKKSIQSQLTEYKEFILTVTKNQVLIINDSLFI